MHVHLLRRHLLHVLGRQLGSRLGSGWCDSSWSRWKGALGWSGSSRSHDLLWRLMLQRRLILELLWRLVVYLLLLHNLGLHRRHVDWRLAYDLSWGCRDGHRWSGCSRLVHLSNWLLLLGPRLSLLLLCASRFYSLSCWFIVAIVCNNLCRRRSLYLFLSLTLELFRLVTIFIVLNLRLLLLRSLLVLLLVLLSFLHQSGSNRLNNVRCGWGLNTALHDFKISFK